MVSLKNYDTVVKIIRCGCVHTKYDWNKKANAKSHTHCQVAQKSRHTNQNLSKSMAAPTLTEKKARAYNKVYKSLVNKWLK